MGYYVTNFFRKQQTSLYVQKHGAEVAATACKRRAGSRGGAPPLAILPSYHDAKLKLLHLQRYSNHDGENKNVAETW